VLTEGDIRSRGHSTGQRPAYHDTGESDSEPDNELAEGATELYNGKEPPGDTNRKSHFVDRAPRPPESYNRFRDNAGFFVLMTPRLFHSNSGDVPVEPDRPCWGHTKQKLFSKYSNHCENDA